MDIPDTRVADHTLGPSRVRLVSLAFGPYADIESFNPDFRPGHPKMRVTVDVDPAPPLEDEALRERLLGAFPGLAAHRCHVEGGRAPADGILLVEGDASANQAHLLEHLMLEMLGFLDRVRRLSGLTCAYVSPPERNDIFVECERPESGSLVAFMALEAIRAALAGKPLAPGYPDMLHCARELREQRAAAWVATGLARVTGLPHERVAAALQALSEARVVEQDSYAMNLSGEPLYRFLGVGGATP